MTQAAQGGSAFQSSQRRKEKKQAGHHLGQTAKDAVWTRGAHKGPEKSHR